MTAATAWSMDAQNYRRWQLRCRRAGAADQGRSRGDRPRIGARHDDRASRRPRRLPVALARPHAADAVRARSPGFGGAAGIAASGERHVDGQGIDRFGGLPDRARVPGARRRACIRAVGRPRPAGRSRILVQCRPRRRGTAMGARLGAPVAPARSEVQNLGGSPRRRRRPTPRMHERQADSRATSGAG